MHTQKIEEEEAGEDSEKMKAIRYAGVDGITADKSMGHAAHCYYSYEWCVCECTRYDG